jgi:transglutaminase-like putative cysteine protease
VTTKTTLTRSQFALLAITVAATIATHLSHLPPWLTPALALVVAARVWWRRGHEGAVAAAIRLPLALALLAAIVGEYGNVLGRDPGSAFGCGLLALKLLETETPRDARVVLGFCAFVLMSALLFEQSLPFTLLVCAVLVLQVAAFNRLEPAPLSNARPLRGSLALAGKLVLAAIPLALASFILVPRLGSPLWGSPNGNAGARTGLSDSMAPGQFTDLMSDDSPAFRVAFDGAPPPPNAQYFRAIVLSDFDGTTWTRALSGLRRNLPPATATTGTNVDYRITLEPTQQRWLPALDVPTVAPDDAALAGDDTIVANRPTVQPREYRVRSTIGAIDATALSAAQRERLLRLPRDADPRARSLAAQWRNESADDDAVVQRALAMFHASFTYTLNPPLLGRDSVDEFLFDTRKGFCEHYASAFVFLMRAAGIPARVVTGYQGGWWSDSGSYLLVRQSDAHAWAEVWRDGRGWQRVDPTAAVSPARIERGAAQVNDAADWTQSNWLRELRNRIDIVNRLWSQGVIRFDGFRQRALLADFGITRNEGGDLLMILSGVLAFAMLIATIWAMRGARDDRGDALDRVWSRLRGDLRNAGFSAKPSEGPRAMSDALRARDAGLAESLHPLVDEYARLRYALAQPPREAVERLSSDVRRWSRTHLRRRAIQRRLRRMAALFGAAHPD